MVIESNSLRLVIKNILYIMVIELLRFELILKFVILGFLLRLISRFVGLMF